MRDVTNRMRAFESKLDSLLETGKVDRISDAIEREFVRQCRFYEAESVSDVKRNYPSLSKMAFLSPKFWSGYYNLHAPTLKAKMQDEIFPGVYEDQQREYHELTCIGTSLWLPRINPHYVTLENVRIGNFRTPIVREIFEAIEFDIIDLDAAYQRMSGICNEPDSIPGIFIYRYAEDYDPDCTRALEEIMRSDPAAEFDIEFQAMDPFYALKYTGTGMRGRKLFITDIERNSGSRETVQDIPKGHLVNML